MPKRRGNRNKRAPSSHRGGKSRKKLREAEVAYMRKRKTAFVIEAPRKETGFYALFKRASIPFNNIGFTVGTAVGKLSKVRQHG